MTKLNLEKMAKLLDIENNTDLVKELIKGITNDTVDIKDIERYGVNYEIFMSDNSGFTNKELKGIQEFFNIEEIGIYGDTCVPDENVYFHMIVSFIE